VANEDALAAASFPLCMQLLLHKVREDYHLKPGGRQQLGLFLKVSHNGSCGMTDGCARLGPRIYHLCGGFDVGKVFCSGLRNCLSGSIDGLLVGFALARLALVFKPLFDVR
jgi:hypothetical protein